ncbi:protein of unknown function DUF4040 [Desulfovibrio sp. X2]|uniref:hydrogenase subunit MbhD domain-containing protein n=1 Tax=Desulfovibrio sp. X2 TaxID=941449 RepID=UPI000358D91F|nr:hydrogenase subunit MbhD domain-containing protein [Desulfovibrio sp. X2]EPR36325.1 protein of unknown function DUF4040 [Desulfovibrio sp. X2]
MIWQLSYATLILVMVCAVASLWIRDLMGAAILFGAYSFLMCTQWLAMGAVDVAFTEAAIGAGISSALVFAAIFRTTRRSKD